MNKSITELTAEAVTALLAQSQGTSPDMTLESFGFFLDDYVILGGDMTVKANDPNHFSITEIVVSFNDLLLRLPGKDFNVRDTGVNTYFLDFTMDNGFVLSKVHPNVPYLPLWVINTNASGDITATTDQRGDMGYVRFRSEIAGLVQDNIVVDEMHIANDAVSTAKIKDSAITTAKINAGSVNLSKLASDVLAQLGGTGDIGNGSIGTTFLADSAVTTAKLADGAVTAPKIPDGTVTLDKLGNDAKSAIAGMGGLVDGAITTARLADDAVTTVKIKNDAVTTTKIADGAVTTAKIPNASITSAKLGADVRTELDGKAPTAHVHTMSQVTGLPTELAGKAAAIHGHTIAQVTGLQAALDLKASSALATVDTDGLMSGPDKAKLDSIGGAGGGELLDGAVTTLKIADSAVTSAKIAELSVGAGHIQDAAISQEKLSPASVGATHLQEAAITTVAIADDAITTLKLAPNTVTGSKIAINTIDGSHIADASISSAELAGFAVTNAKLADTSVTSTKIADSAVTNAKIATGTISKAKLDTTLQASIGNNKIDGLADVDNTAKADGRVLKWNAAALKHIYADDNGGTGTTSSVDWINVKAKGAVGNGVANDTAAIQSAIDALPGTGGTVYVPDGTYMITVASAYTSNPGSLRLKSNMTFLMSKNAILKAVTNSLNNSDVLRVKGISNVTIEGGVLLGERYTHTGDTSVTSQVGVGIWLQGASDIRIINVTCKDFWGDGIYTRYDDTLGNNKNIWISGYRAVNNRRQGISICANERITVTNSIFEDTNGIPLASNGIDIEPELGGSVTEATITNCIFRNNRIGFTGLGAATATVSGCTFVGNVLHGVYLGDSSAYYTITGNAFDSNETNGIYLNKAVDNVISGNVIKSSGMSRSDGTIKNAGAHGIHVLNGCFRNVISGNRSTKNTGHGIYVYNSHNNNITGNHCTENTNSGINTVISNNSNVSSNHCCNNTQSGVYISGGKLNAANNNLCNQNGAQGVRVTDSADAIVTGNLCSENSQATHNTNDNIFISGTSTNVTVQCNTCRRGTTTNQPRYGIRIDSGVTGTLFRLNDVRGGGVTGDSVDVGTGTVTT